MYFLAIRHLLSRKRQTLLILLGIVLGTAAYIAISSMLDGFQNFIIDQLINNDAQVRISSREQPITPAEVKQILYDGEFIKWQRPPAGRRDSAKIDNPQMWFDLLNRDPDVSAFSPQLNTQGIARREKITRGIRVFGIDPARQTQVTNIEKYVKSGKFSDLATSGNRLIAGIGLLERLGAQDGETILISSSTGTATPFKVVGSFQVGFGGLDNNAVYVNIKDAQKLNQTPSVISDIAIRLHDVTKAIEKSNEWALLSRDKVESWEQASANTLSVFRTQNITRIAMTISILVVAAFGIYNILNMTVAQKRREIAILRSIGYNSKDILQLFFIQGLILGLLGSLIGCLLGYAIATGMSHIQVGTPGTRGMGMQPSRMMISFDLIIYIQAFAMGLASAAFASFLPARAAGKLTPIEIIRSEVS